jgi:hypothetical protein
MNHELTFGLAGQTIARRSMRRPSTATFAIIVDASGDDDAAEFGGAAVVDSATTTTTAIAGFGAADARLLAVVSAAGFIVGRKYRLRGDAQVEWAEPIRIAGNVITVRYPLGGVFAIGAALESTYVTAAIDDVWAATVSKLSDGANPWPDYRVRWSLDGTVEYDGLDLLRTVNSFDVTVDDLSARIPGLRDRMPIEFRDDAGAKLLAAAWDSLQLDLLESGTTPAVTHSKQAINEALLLKARLVLAEGGYHPAGSDPTAFYAMAEATYGRFFERHFKLAAKHAMTSTTGAAVPRVPVAIWEK